MDGAECGGDADVECGAADVDGDGGRRRGDGGDCWAASTDWDGIRMERACRLRSAGVARRRRRRQVNANGSIAGVTVTQGGVGCSATTTASVNAAGTWDTAAPVNLIGGQNMTFFAGNLLKGTGGYTVWNAAARRVTEHNWTAEAEHCRAAGLTPLWSESGRVGSAFQVDQFPGADIGAKIQACVNAVSASYGGTCDARNFTGNLSMGSNLTIATANMAILLPCATITTANQIVVTAGTRNVALRGCALRGGTAASGSTGRNGVCVLGIGRDGGGGRSDLCDGYAGLPHGQRGD